MKIVYVKFLSVIFLMFVVLGCMILEGCGPDKVKTKVHGMQDKVVKVHTGNKIELQNGLKVEILGITPSEHTKEYLEKHVKNEIVVLSRDSKQREFINSTKTTVKAYVKLKGERISVSGKMLANKTAKLRQTAVTDSIECYREYANQDIRRPNMSTEELFTYVKPASFQIVLADGSTGTGFFISEDGLALTNNHVLDGSTNALVCFFGENGTLDETNTRRINSIVQTYRKDRIDFTIFYVQLRPNEKVRYLPLISKHEREAAEVFKMGCPVGLHGDFKPGVLGTYFDGWYFSHSCPSNHGDSGGPIVNKKGEVVGINQSIEFNQVINEKAEGIAYGVDALLIRELLDDNQIKYGK